jgi:hypothetical protein
VGRSVRRVIHLEPSVLAGTCHFDKCSSHSVKERNDNIQYDFAHLMG